MALVCGLRANLSTCSNCAEFLECRQRDDVSVVATIKGNIKGTWIRVEGKENFINNQLLARSKMMSFFKQHILGTVLSYKNVGSFKPTSSGQHLRSP